MENGTKRAPRRSFSLLQIAELFVVTPKRPMDKYTRRTTIKNKHSAHMQTSAEQTERGGISIRFSIMFSVFVYLVYPRFDTSPCRVRNQAASSGSCVGHMRKPSGTAAVNAKANQLVHPPGLSHPPVSHVGRRGTTLSQLTWLHISRQTKKRSKR